MTYDEIMKLEGRELDAAIAEFMETPFRKPTHGTCCTCQVCGWDYDNCQCDYSADIAAAWEVEEHIKELGLTTRYGYCLNRIINDEHDRARLAGEDTYTERWQLIHATAEQRCRAALLAVQL